MTTGEKVLISYMAATMVALILAVSCKDIKHILNWHNELSETKTPAEMEAINARWWRKHVEKQ